MLKSNFLTSKLNLMKKMNLFQLGGSVKVAVAMMAFFFVSLSSLSAQYIAPNDAMVVLKQEVESLDVLADQTNDDDELMDIRFKKDYFMLVLNDLENGTQVGTAIQGNRPRAVPQTAPNGWLVYSSHTNDLKERADDIIAYTEELLAE